LGGWKEKSGIGEGITHLGSRKGEVPYAAGGEVQNRPKQENRIKGRVSWGDVQKQRDKPSTLQGGAKIDQHAKNERPKKRDEHDLCSLQEGGKGRLRMAGRERRGELTAMRQHMQEEEETGAKRQVTGQQGHRPTGHGRADDQL